VSPSLTRFTSIDLIRIEHYTPQTKGDDRYTQPQEQGLGFTALNQITARAMLADREIFCLIERTIL